MTVSGELTPRKAKKRAAKHKLKTAGKYGGLHHEVVFVRQSLRTQLSEQWYNREVNRVIQGQTKAGGNAMDLPVSYLTYIVFLKQTKLTKANSVCLYLINNNKNNILQFFLQYFNTDY